MCELRNSPKNDNCSQASNWGFYGCEADIQTHNHRHKTNKPCHNGINLRYKLQRKHACGVLKAGISITTGVFPLTNLVSIKC